MNNMSRELTTSGAAAPLVKSWHEFSAEDLPEAEKVIFELERGEVGVLNAATNIGKTTLALNLAVSLAAGRAFCPLAEEKAGGRRVLVVDGETRRARYQRDIKRMVGTLTADEQERVGENLFFACDALIGGAPLDLTNDAHMAALKREASACRADLIIVDTLSALFSVNSENDNAEMTRRVMRPLDALARATDAAVLVLHHIGKQSEDSRAGVDAYKGRGASAIGGFARLALLLTPHTKDESCVTLKCAKSKGEKFEKIVLRLDPGTRWFAPAKDSAPGKKPNFMMVVETVTAYNRPVKRKEIGNALADRMSNSTITRNLNEASRLGLLVSHEHGYWSSPGAAVFPGDDEGISSELPLIEDSPGLVN
jgi:hypothetical protein